MNQAIIIALITAAFHDQVKQLQAKLTSFKSHHTLKAYEWTTIMKDDKASNPTTQTTTLAADLGVLYDLPLELGQNSSFAQNAALYIGGI